jgi:hypothetical protein
MMPKTKKKDKMKTKAEGSGKSLLVEPSSKCKEFVVALIARFYERESTMSLESICGRGHHQIQNGHDTEDDGRSSQ